MGYSISATQGDIAQYHDERLYTPDNAREDLKQFNRTIVKQDCSYHDAFNELFKDDVKAYNATQKRNDRKINDYYDSLQDSKRKEKPIYEYVFQIGNHETNSVMSYDEENMLCREALDSAMDKLQERYTAFHFMFIGAHGDEPKGTYHYHVAFTPVGTGYKNGLQKRCSLTKALNSMGFKSSEDDGYAITQWQNDVKDLIEHEMLQRGLEREYMNDTDKHLSVSDFKHSKMIEKMYNDAGYLLERYDELDAKEQALDKRSKDLEQAEARVRLKTKSLDNRKAELDTKEQSLNTRATMLDAKEQNINSLVDAKVKQELKKREARREQALTAVVTAPQRRHRGEDIDFGIY